MKTSSVYVCQRCEFQSTKWIGQCPQCGNWNTFVETLSSSTSSSKSKNHAQHASLVKLSQVQQTEHSYLRIPTGMQEFDRVLGGGIVLGSVSLIGGEPGIGKSTILTQLMINILNDSNKKYRIMYVCGEESPQQITLRIERMVRKKLSNESWKDRVLFLPSTEVDACISSIEEEKPDLVIIDSMQSMHTDDLTGTSGSVGQLKECTQRCTQLAKTLHIPMFLVGHVTKEGSIAGPKVLEHIVDTVLELSGERSGFFRLLRCVKNRFGATDEVGVFHVVEHGLEEVTNPSKIFLSETQQNVAGSAIVPVIEGTRPVLVEIQALVVESQLAMPRRVGRGISLPRIQLLTAVLQKHCGLPLGSMDVFVNVAGGFVVNEPGADLAIAMAIASSLKNIPLPNDTAYVGEIGLLGEIRSVSMLEKRVKEAQRLGFTHVMTQKIASRLSEVVRMLGTQSKGRKP